MYRKYSIEKLFLIKEEVNNLYENLAFESSYEYFILRENKLLIGIASIEKIGDKYYLRDIFVKENYRFKSYGSKLIKQVVNYIASKGFDKLYLELKEEEKGFFYKNHFRQCGEEMVLESLLEDQLRKKEGIFGTIVSIIVNVFLSIFKIIFGILGKSTALVADGIHSLSDVAGSLVILVSIHMGSKPADEEHPMGHGKIESIAGTIVGVLLLLTAFELVSSNLGAFRSLEKIQKPNIYTIVVALISIIIKYLLYLYKNSMGIRLNNDAIVADAKEHRSDVISTLGVLVGISLAIYIHPIFDSISGILVSIFIGKEGISIIKETSSKILDTQDMSLVEEIKKYSNSFDEIFDTHDIILMYSGDKIYSSLHIRVDKSMTVCEAHKLADDLKYSILEDFKRINDIIIHIDPIISEN